MYNVSCLLHLFLFSLAVVRHNTFVLKWKWKTVRSEKRFVRRFLFLFPVSGHLSSVCAIALFSLVPLGFWFISEISWWSLNTLLLPAVMVGLERKEHITMMCSDVFFVPYNARNQICFLSLCHVTC